jgi:hypothetical protein
MVRIGRLALLALCVTLIGSPAFAQGGTAAIGGTVTDESRSVLPGANVVATELSTGRTFQGVTDERGEYRIANVAPGKYKVQAELSGFATVVYPEVEVLVGQNAELLFSLKLGAIEETVQVSGQAPLVDTSSVAIAGNVDRRQLENMPLSGRNWLELSMLIKGITANSVSTTPGVNNQDQYNLNIDGQQVSQRIGSLAFGQVKFSRESIAEFQIVTNQYDITQGRSTGMQVQAITKAGTNSEAGACCRIRTSSSEARSAGRSSRTRSSTSDRSSTSASRSPRCPTRRCCRARASRSSRRRQRRFISCAATTSGRPTTTSASAGAATST